MRKKVSSLGHGTELMSCLGSKIQDLVPVDTKKSDCLNAFIFKSKRWIPEGRSQKITKIYLM